MKILRRGTPPSEKLYVGTCLKCFSMVEFSQHEAGRIEGMRDVLYYVDCPVCPNGESKIYGREK